MEELFRDLIEWMTAIRPFWAYVIILLIAYGENVLPPIPGDLVVVFGGYLAGIGRLSLAMVITLSAIGGAIGFMSMYAIGRHIGDAVFDPKRLRWLPKKRIGKARDWLHRWGYGVVAANRFLSGARSVIALTVGMAKMNAWQTAAFAMLSATVWCALISYAGFAVGENWEVVGEYLRSYGNVVVGLLLLVILVQVLRHYLKRRRGRVTASDEGGFTEA